MSDGIPPLALVPGLAEKFWPRVDATGDCWEWNGPRMKTGYGQFSLRTGDKRMAHRVSWELLVGPIPLRYQIDHLCFNEGCVNPDHLEPVERRVNLQRRRWDGAKRNASLTRCPQGHPYSDENTYVSARGRTCRACARTREQARVRDYTPNPLNPPCAEPGCDRLSMYQGVCRRCYKRNWRAKRADKNVLAR